MEAKRFLCLFLFLVLRSFVSSSFFLIFLLVLLLFLFTCFPSFILTVFLHSSFSRKPNNATMISPHSFWEVQDDAEKIC